MTSWSVLTSTVLRGHKDVVNCFEQQNNGLLLSGSSDRSVRFWDLKMSRACKIITNCFDGGVESMQITHKNNNLLVAATVSSVYSFDLRFEGVLQKTPVSQITQKGHFEDVNAVSISPKDDSVAIADDSGAITLIPITPSGVLGSTESYKANGDGGGKDSDGFGRNYRRLLRGHTNLVNCIAFNPSNQRELISGGFDCKLCLWDVNGSKPKLTTLCTHLVEEGDEDCSSSNKMFNPPFVQCLAYVCDGKGVAAGLGDGTVRIFNPKDNLTGQFSVPMAHGGMVTSICAKKLGGREDQFLVTGGIDRNVNLWQIRKTEGGGVGVGVGKGNGNGKGKGKGNGGSKAMAPLFGVSSVDKKYSILHGSKVNCVFVADSNVDVDVDLDSKVDVDLDLDGGENKYKEADEADEAADSTAALSFLGTSYIVVADVTNNITLYQARSR